MRNAIAVIFLACLAVPGDALAASPVDLDKPGAIEALARDRPSHYKKVMEEIAKAQVVPVDPVPTRRDARMDDRSKDATVVLPSDPAQKRLQLVIEGTEYRVTARMTKDPARLEKAK